MHARSFFHKNQVSTQERRLLLIFRIINHLPYPVAAENLSRLHISESQAEIFFNFSRSLESISTTKIFMTPESRFYSKCEIELLSMINSPKRVKLAPHLNEFTTILLGLAKSLKASGIALRTRPVTCKPHWIKQV